ncbi:matrix-remodeling-associated protein 7 isoform X2 [Pelobates fuscus]|uniref:matrix-remodeling-associated protein 7 isoform X2 n=1 Tax=Pelobates fuscus TaxID=191477 RepID=UPI002FE492E3
MGNREEGKDHSSQLLHHPPVSAQPLPAPENKSPLIHISMDLEGDYSFTVPLLFTVLAVILATLLMKLRSGEDKPPGQVTQEEEEKEEEEENVAEHLEDTQDHTIPQEKIAVQEGTESIQQTAKISVDEVGASEDLLQERTTENETEAEGSSAKERRASTHSSIEGDDSKEEDFELESDKILKISEAEDADDEDFSFKYCPGKLRGSEYEKMLTKEELDEEQRNEEIEKLPLQSS